MSVLIVKRSAIACIAAAAMLLVTVGSVVPASAAASFDPGRSINGESWFTWPRYVAADRPDIDWPPFHGNNRLDDQFASLKSYGFDSIRFGVDPAPFIYFRDERREELYSQLTSLIDRLIQKDLRAIVFISVNNENRYWSPIATFEGDRFGEFRGFLRELTRVLARFDLNRVALEVFNEPGASCNSEDAGRWQFASSRLLADVRSISDKMTVLMSAGCHGTVDGLTRLVPVTNDENILYTFHYYHPFAFTHQGAHFIRTPERSIGGLPWGIDWSRDDANVRRDLNVRKYVKIDGSIDEARSAEDIVGKYLRSKPSARDVEFQFQKVDAWSSHYNIPKSQIFLGEFGVYKSVNGAMGASCADRIRWLTAVRSAADARGIKWSFFSMDGPFGLFLNGRPDDQTLATLSALSLAEPRPCP